MSSSEGLRDVRCVTGDAEVGDGVESAASAGDTERGRNARLTFRLWTRRVVTLGGDVRWDSQGGKAATQFGSSKATT